MALLGRGACVLVAAGVFQIPLVLPASLEPRRAELAAALLGAQRRLVAFAGRHGWERHLAEPFADQAEVFDKKEDFDRRCLALCQAPADTVLPATYSAALESRVLVAVSPELYRANFPPGDEPEAFERLLCHELAHRLHVRILGGDEDAMGPVWFFEGFALEAADQFRGLAPPVDDDELWTIVGAAGRGSYLKYAAVFRRFLSVAPLETLVHRAGKQGFVAYLRLLPAASDSFETERDRLVALARVVHEMGNALGGQSFADERGWLKPEECRELERDEARLQALSAQLEQRCDGLRRRHPAAWSAYAERTRAVLARLASAPEVREFDRLLAVDLAAAWADLALGASGMHSTSWALAVGTLLVESYGRPATVP